MRGRGNQGELRTCPTYVTTAAAGVQWQSQNDTEFTA